MFDRELHLAVLARVVTVGAVEHRLAVALQVVARGKARHDRGGIHGRDVARRVGAHRLEARAEVQRQARRHRPAILQVDRRRVDVDLRAARSPGRSRPRLTPGVNTGTGAPCASRTTVPFGRQVVGDEHVPVDDCELPPMPVLTKYSAPPLSSWLP